MRYWVTEQKAVGFVATVDLMKTDSTLHPQELVAFARGEGRWTVVPFHHIEFVRDLVASYLQRFPPVEEDDRCH